MSIEEDGFIFCNHPLIINKITQMRRTKTASRDFVRIMKELGMLMAYEVTKDIELELKEIETSNGFKKAKLIGQKKPVIAPVLRTGLVLADGIQEVIASTYIAHIGIHHDKKSKIVIDYLFTLPRTENYEERIFIIVDPIIETGVTASLAIQKLRNVGISYKSIRFVSLMVGKEGRSRINKDHGSDVKVYAALLDGDGENDAIINDIGSVSNHIYRTN